ncbi:MAG: CerR family C-terminal domain-containing protein [Akkermansiaceae bacterium]|nr:CerR family C-terminal domain-containing protein [Armatimonadota bacterium]
MARPGLYQRRICKAASRRAAEIDAERGRSERVRRKARVTEATLPRRQGVRRAPEVLGANLEPHLTKFVAQRLLTIRNEDANRIVLLWVREQIAPSPAFEFFFRHVTMSILNPCSLLIGRLIGRDASDKESRARVFLLVGQILVFCIARVAVQRVMDWDSYTPERTTYIRDLVREHIAAIYGRPEDAGGG